MNPLASFAQNLPDLQRRNREQLAQDFASARTWLTGKPVHLKLELTNYCNLSCPLCPHSTMQRPIGYMKPELFRRIIDQAVPELEFAYVHHLGESLFHPRVGDLIAYGTRAGVAMGLSTNANFLSEKKTAAILASGLRFLVVSLDAVSTESYQHMRKGGDFAKTVRNVERFLERVAMQQSPLDVAVQMIVAKHNEHEIEAFARRWPKHVVFKQARDWAGQVPLEQLRSKRAQATPTAWRDPNTPPCRMPFTELTVLFDGRVVPCANVFEPINVLGNLCRDTLAAVWNGAPVRQLRAAHLHKNASRVPICQNCAGHLLDPNDFVAVDQLAQRLRNYRGGLLVPRPGLS